MELYNRTLGVIGLGNIGRIVAERARGLGMKVIAYDPVPLRRRRREARRRAASTSTRCSRAPTPSRVHVPKTKETTGLLGQARVREGAAAACCS